MTDWIVSLMERLGSPGAGLLDALESTFPPIPSELILPLAEFAAGEGDLTLAGAVAWTTLGSLVGALVLSSHRLVPGVRSLISIPAGVARMPLTRFVLLTGAGSLVWNSLLIFAGYASARAGASCRPGSDGSRRS